MIKNKILIIFALTNIVMLLCLPFYNSPTIYSFIIISILELFVFSYLYNKQALLLKKQKTTFATITHDLKTPTIAQLRAVEFLLDEKFGSINSNQTEILSQIKESCVYMKSLIFGVLDSFLNNNETLIIHKEKHNIMDTINSVIKEISPLLKEKGQNIVVKTTLKNEEIFADKIQLKRVITNLVSNSVVYGNKNCMIEISLEEENNCFVFKIKNNSEYIPKEKIKNIFSKSQNIEKNQNKTGTGLGLYLTKNLIEQHGGNVFAKSYLDGNCIFGFKIPQDTVEKETKTTRQEEIV